MQQCVNSLVRLPTAAVRRLPCTPEFFVRPFSAAAASATSSVSGSPSAAAQSSRRKVYSDLNRAKKVLASIKCDHQERMSAKLATFRPPFPQFDVGDAIELTYGEAVGNTGSSTIRGTVIAKYNKGIDSSFTVINRMEDDHFFANYKLSSPLLRTIRIMRKRRATDGKRVRRNKLYYLWRDEDDSQWRVDKDTKEAWEVDLERRIRDELAARGRTASKKAILEEKNKLLRTGKGILQLERY